VHAEALAGLAGRLEGGRLLPVGQAGDGHRGHVDLRDPVAGALQQGQVGHAVAPAGEAHDDLLAWAHHVVGQHALHEDLFDVRDEALRVELLGAAFEGTHGVEEDRLRVHRVGLAQHLRLRAAQHVEVVVADLAHLDHVVGADDRGVLGDDLAVAPGEHRVDRDAVASQHVGERLPDGRGQLLAGAYLVAKENGRHRRPFMIRVHPGAIA